MLLLRRVPRVRTPVSAALTAAETTTALAIAHTAAGGEAPSAGWLLVVAATVYGAAALVLRRVVPLRAAVPALVGVQVLLHAWLVALTSEHAAHAHAGGEGVLGLSWPMVAAHVLAGAVTAVALVLRRRAVAVLLSWRDQPRLAVPLRGPRRPNRAPFALVTRLLADAAPTRGPPAAAVATA